MSLKMPNLLEILNATAETNRLDVTELTTKVNNDERNNTRLIIFHSYGPIIKLSFKFLLGYHSLNRSRQPPGHENDYVCARAIREMSSKEYPVISAPNSIKVRRHSRKNYPSHIGKKSKI